MNMNLCATLFEKDWGINPSLGCPYCGPNSSYLYSAIWRNSSLGSQIELMSRYCVDGSAADLDLDKWNELCFPAFKEESTVGRNLAGVWALFTMILGIFGNLLTLIAIPYARWKRRHEFHQNFRTTHIWVLHLALVELMFCIMSLPVVVVFPYLGIRFLQISGMDTVIRLAFITGNQMIQLDWLLLSIIVLTSAIKLKYPEKWDNFCENKAYVAMFLIFPWIISLFYILPYLVQPSLDFGYHCLFGHPSFIPTGKAPLPFLAENKWIQDELPAAVSFFLPVGIITISYLVIWRHIKKVRGDLHGVANVRKSGLGGVLSQIEIRFIWTVFIVCIFYVIASAPLAFSKMIRELRTPTFMLVVISLMLAQYSANFFIYSYNCKQYRLAYWDVLLLVFPCLSKTRDRWEGPMNASGTNTPTAITKITKNSSSALNDTILSKNTSRR
jgi:hypothetical protein